MKTYDPKQVQIIVGGVPITGFADGTFVRVGHRNVAWELSVGADGEGVRTKSNDESGFIEITLQQSSKSNQYLSDLYNADRLSNAGLVSGLVKDGSGSSLHAAEQMFIENDAEAEYSKTASPRVWMFLTDKLINFHGGN